MLSSSPQYTLLGRKDQRRTQPDADEKSQAQGFQHPHQCIQEGKTPLSHTVYRITTIIRRLQKGQPVELQPWSTFTLSVDEYLSLQDYINADDRLAGYWDDKLRYDYDPINSQFILRMPGLIHENIIRSVNREILKQLDQYLETSSFSTQTRAVISNIRSIGSARIRLDLGQQNDRTSVAIRDPDDSFITRGAGFPTVVIEVAHGQPDKKLRTLAYDYVVGSDGRINAVIGLDIEYKKLKMALASIWKPVYQNSEEDGVMELRRGHIIEFEPFIRKDGSTVDDFSLSIPLLAFTTETETSTPELVSHHITISAGQLSSFLHDAYVHEEESLHPSTLAFSPNNPNTLIRKRTKSMSSNEEFTKEDNAICRDHHPSPCNSIPHSSTKAPS